MMRNRIAFPLLVLGGLLGSAAIAQSLPSAPESHLDAPAAPHAEAAAYSSSAPASSLTPAGLRGEAAAMPQFGRGVIFFPVPPPPALPQFSTPTALGMVIGGTIGGVVGFNRDSEADRPAGAFAGIVLGGIAGALVGHIYNEVHTLRCQGGAHRRCLPHCPPRRCGCAPGGSGGSAPSHP
ncbi:MAG: hypothetical protein WA294_12280 [Acidobacteriaceae bacterium]